jgi:hypothetical protein
MDRSTKMAFIIFAVAVVLMLALAAYGYFSGVWMAEFD